MTLMAPTPNGLHPLTANRMTMTAMPLSPTGESSTRPFFPYVTPHLSYVLPTSFFCSDSGSDSASDSASDSGSDSSSDSASDSGSDSSSETSVEDTLGVRSALEAWIVEEFDELDDSDEEAAEESLRRERIKHTRPVLTISHLAHIPCPPFAPYATPYSPPQASREQGEEPRPSRCVQKHCKLHVLTGRGRGAGGRGGGGGANRATWPCEASETATQS